MPDTQTRSPTWTRLTWRTDGFDDADAAMTLNDGAWCSAKGAASALAADHLPVGRRRVRPLVERQPDRLLQGRDRQEVCRELPHRPPVRRLHRAGGAGGTESTALTLE